MCFELLGFDIIIDDQLKPWLLEVNSFPSFATGSPIDESIKRRLFIDTFRIVNIRSQDLHEKSKKEAALHGKSNREALLTLLDRAQKYQKS